LLTKGKYLVVGLLGKLLRNPKCFAFALPLWSVAPEAMADAEASPFLGQFGLLMPSTYLFGKTNLPIDIYVLLSSHPAMLRHKRQNPRLPDAVG
jgi:hypothetical protein